MFYHKEVLSMFRNNPKKSQPNQRPNTGEYNSVTQVPPQNAGHTQAPNRLPMSDTYHTVAGLTQQPETYDNIPPAAQHGAADSQYTRAPAPDPNLLVPGTVVTPAINNSTSSQYTAAPTTNPHDNTYSTAPAPNDIYVAALSNPNQISSTQSNSPPLRDPRNNPLDLNLIATINTALNQHFNTTHVNYFHNVTRNEGNASLDHQPAYTFLIRPSTQPNIITISACDDCDDTQARIKHIRLTYHNGQFTDDNQHVYPSLISYLKQFPKLQNALPDTSPFATTLLQAVSQHISQVRTTPPRSNSADSPASLFTHSPFPQHLRTALATQSDASTPPIKHHATPKRPSSTGVSAPATPTNPLKHNAQSGSSPYHAVPHNPGVLVSTIQRLNSETMSAFMLDDADYYWNTIPKNIIHDALKSGRDGSFLFRASSSSPGSIVITYKLNNQIASALIKRDERGWVDSDNNHYATMSQYFEAHSDLNTPLSKPTISATPPLERKSKSPVLPIATTDAFQDASLPRTPLASQSYN